MKTCEKCGVELDKTETFIGHTPERCRDRLAARLAEVERAMAAGYESQIAALRAELAECRAELIATQSESARVVDVQRTRAEAAEARAERLHKESRKRGLVLGAARAFIQDDLDRGYVLTHEPNAAAYWRSRRIEVLSGIDAALAETEKEKP